MCLVPPPTEPFHKLHIDFMGPFKPSRAKHTYILNIVDHLTRYIELKSVTTQDTKHAIQALESQIIYRYGCPRIITHDQGTVFESHEFKEFAKKYNIKIQRTSAYHPQSNGIVERPNDTVKTIISKYVNDKHTNWSDKLPHVAFAINTTIHAVTRHTPYYLLFGTEPFLPCDAKLQLITAKIDDENPSQRQNRSIEAREQARQNTIHFQIKQKEKFDEKHPTIQFYPGDLVLLINNAYTKGDTRKFNEKWRGPYRILHQTGPTNYKISNDSILHNSKTTTKVVHVSQIKLSYPPYCCIPSNLGTNSFTKMDSTKREVTIAA